MSKKIVMAVTLASFMAPVCGFTVPGEIQPGADNDRDVRADMRQPVKKSAPRNKGEYCKMVDAQMKCFTSEERFRPSC